MNTATEEEPRARTAMRKYYWEDKSARFRRLQRLVKIYIRMLEWAVHQASDWQLGKSAHRFSFGCKDLAALGLFTIADVDWRDSDCVALVYCVDEEKERGGCLSGDTLTPGAYHGSPEPYKEDSSVTDVYFREKIEFLPSNFVAIALIQAHAASEEALLAVQIQWGGSPFFKHCEDGMRLLEYMRRAKLTREELLSDLGDFRTDRIGNIWSARRGAYRSSEGSSTDRDEDSGVLRTGEEPSWLRAAEFTRRASRAASVEWDWPKWKRFLDKHDVPTKPDRKQDGSVATRRRLVSAGDAVCALRCAIDSGEFDEMKTDRDWRRQRIHENIDKEFGSAHLIDEFLSGDS